MKTRLLHAAFFTPLHDGRWGLPLLLWSPPGAAKTAAIRQLAERLGWHCEHLTPGERGEGAFGVTPVPEVNGSGKTILTYPPPEWVRSLRKPLPGSNGDPEWEEEGVIFFDEINTCAPALAPALLGGIQERRIGGHTFGPRVRVVGAANPVGHAAGGWDLAAPVANRLGHLEWPAPDPEEWGAWLLGGAAPGEPIDARAEEARVLRAWPDAWAVACGLAAAFVRRRPGLLHRMPEDGDPAQSRAWPSNRTWEYAARAWAAARVHGLSEIEADELVAAFIGGAAAGEWATWIQEADLPEPAEVLDEKVGWEHDPKRLDRTEAVLAACTALVAPKGAKRRNKRAEALWGLLLGVMDDAKDLCVAPATALVGARLQKLGAAARPLRLLHDVVRASGMMEGRQ